MTSIMSPMLSPTSALLALIIVSVIFYTKRRNAAVNPRKLPLPPGPQGRPLIGNLLDDSGKEPWLWYSAMTKKFGDIMYLKMLNQHVIVVSSIEAVSDLFDKRGQIYSDRFQSVMLTELIDMGWSFGLVNYDEYLRRQRKIFHQYYSATAIRQYEGLQFENTRELLRRLRSNPERFFEHARFVFAALLMTVTYGVHIEDESNEHVVEAEAWQHGFNQAIQPGRFWVDYLPVLKHVPLWFPGVTFKRLAMKWRGHMYNARDRPFDLAKDAMEAGSATPSIVTTALENLADDPNKDEEELMTRYSLGAAFGAGVDTSAPTLQLFFYAMMTYPDVQKKAQAELEKVVGSSRLPIMDDRPSLPYVDAILKELLRWMPVTPLAIPHYTATDDEYRGYHIPKGSIVLGNVWHILHDLVEYPSPEQFMPERFLNTDGTLSSHVLDPAMACFGFGRRICPGRFLSMNSLFCTIACILHTFDIGPVLDQDNKPVKVDLRMQSGMICHPEPFSCSIKVRSVAAEALVTG